LKDRANDPETERLLALCANEQGSAPPELLARHLPRLNRLVEVRLDRRLSARLDPADVVHEALADALRKLPNYLQNRPLPFYPWLRQLTLERVADAHRKHISTECRSVTREEPGPEREAVAFTCAPEDNLLREETRSRVRAALDRLPETDREVLLLRDLEGLSVAEAAGELGISEGALKLRHLRAVRRLRRLLGDWPDVGRS
jgi:RNA polymerase sigma-70 factor (ECF subfamily)